MADVILPELPEDEEYVVRKKPKTQLHILRDERDKLQAELDVMPEPTNDELKELGKQIHPYHIIKGNIQLLKDQIKVITDGN